jgi:transcription elongation factor Elf1
MAGKVKKAAIASAAKKYKCKLCFYEQPLLLKAELRKHYQEKHRYCTICRKTYPKLKDTANHRKKDHPKKVYRGRTPGAAESEFLLPITQRVKGASELQCVYCEKDEKTPGDLEKHLKKEHLVCQECGEDFAKYQTLKDHITLVS